MYCSFFGLTAKPFTASPDPRFLYLSRCHEEALRAIICAINDRLGLISVTGEVGTGKTTVLHSALNWLSTNTRTAFVQNYALEFEDILILILSELKIATLDEKSPKIVALEKLKQFAMEQFKFGGTVAIIVDEAQNLSKEDLENVRLLSNLETPSDKLLQIILSGQPELDRKLEDPALRQLKQRLFRRFHIHALDPKETHEYINHRLKLASGKNGFVLNGTITDEIWLYTEGVPRKINILCSNALRIAFERKIRALDVTIVLTAASELNWQP